MQVQYMPDNMDYEGNLYPTVGENIRNGKQYKEPIPYLIVEVEFGANSATVVNITENTTGVDDIVGNGQSTDINFTSPTHTVVNVKHVEVKEADGEFLLGGICVNSTGAECIRIIESSAGVTAMLKVIVKVDEY